MHRFYLPSLDFKRDYLEIFDHRIVHQAGKVLRMWTDDFFRLFDGKNEYQVQIAEINKRRILVKKVQELKNKAEPKIKVSLYQAIPKKPALFELVVQKATEIGVSEIFPLVTERTENRRMSKFQRLHLIAMEATEQCGRMKIPVIRHPVNYDEIVGKLRNGFIAYEYEGTRYLADYEKDMKGASEIQIIIGPEGGLSESELALAKESSVKPFSLGPRILRTETAAIAALSLMMLNR
ncbi:16S rRNA (uracil(1498)-N(3))-methyltransferase [Patescibacteria group bacterium]|nr:16S rRNA (uracil(1498)-N(3))-methyltransferase [Patescibacteria group bacterium]MBU1685592.1 16S rRNA (uracil(1498)-N(3))-methyltransferase [Patescibacteria group bacterium]